MKYQSGFTILEFVVVATLMSLMVTAVLAATHNTRMKARDTKRVAMAAQMQNAFAAYYRDNRVYPPTVDVVPGQPLVAVDIEYFKEIPSNPEPRTDGSCPDQDFIYSQDDLGVSYHFTFCLGLPSGDLPAGVNTATPAGIY